MLRRSARRPATSIGLALTTGLASVSACAPSAPPRPNVVLLVLDTVRRDRLSCYGYERETTPALDRFARESALYEQAVSAAPWTLPSHASMFTGLPPSEHQAHHEHLGLDASRETLAERLAAVGYETIAVSNNPWVSRRTGLAQGFDTLVEPWREAVAGEGFALNVFPDEARHGFVDAGAAASLEAIEAWLGERDAATPFFLFVNLIEAHGYYAPPAPYGERFSTRELDAEAVREANFAFLRQAHRGRLTERVRGTVRDLYDGELAYLDAWFERFLALLESHALAEESLLVVTSDHGEAFGDHERCSLALVDHQLSLHDELLAVPLIVRYPASSAGAAWNGRRIEAPASTLDLLPTVLEVCGLAAGAAGEAHGLALTRVPEAGERTLVSEYYRPLAHLDTLETLVGDAERIACLADRRVVGLRRGRHKLLLDTRGEAQGYDLLEDPGERSPDAAISPELLEAARLRLERMERGFDVPPPDELDEAQRSALEALGYF